MITAAIAWGAFLDAIAKGESDGSYNELVGGGRFDGFAHFPIWSGLMFPTGISHAAGRYQFQPATWAEVAGELGLKDFSPASQDAGACYLAAKVYRRVTGRNLEADLVAGQLEHVAPALHSTWTSLSAASFPGRFAAAVAQRSVGGTSEAPAIVTAAPAAPRAAAMGTPVNTLAATGLGGWLAYYLLTWLKTRGWPVEDPGMLGSTYGLCTVAAAIVIHLFPWLGASAGTDPPLSQLGVSKMLKVGTAAAVLLLLSACAPAAIIGGAAVTAPVWAPALEAVVQGAVEGYVEAKDADKARH